jgi:hypothetical protein
VFLGLDGIGQAAEALYVGDKFQDDLKEDLDRFKERLEST